MWFVSFQFQENVKDYESYHQPEGCFTYTVVKRRRVFYFFCFDYFDLVRDGVDPGDADGVA